MALDWYSLTEQQWMMFTEEDWASLLRINGNDCDEVSRNGVISGCDYQSIALTYGLARRSILGSKLYLYDAVYLIVLMQSVIVERDLLNTFHDTYVINTHMLEAPTLFMNAVRRLNDTVLAKYATLDDYFEETGITVIQEWADLCEISGQTISQQYITT